MVKNTVYFYCIEGFADWEAGLVLAELNSGRFFRKETPKLNTKTFGLNKTPVTTIGGLKTTPETSINNVDLNDAALLVLPGSDLWMQPGQEKVIELVKNFLENDIPVAAICGATMALAQAGILDDIKHTSNDIGAFKMFCPDYKGEANYINAPAVCDQNLITAGATAQIDFAYLILEQLDVMDEDVLSEWFKLFSSHDSKHFLRIMELLQ